MHQILNWLMQILVKDFQSLSLRYISWHPVLWYNSLQLWLLPSTHTSLDLVPAEFVSLAYLKYWTLSYLDSCGAFSQTPCLAYLSVLCNIYHLHQVFKSHRGIQTHTNSHQNRRPFECLKCGTSLSSPANLRSHMVSIHGDPGDDAKCPHCPKVCHTNRMNFSFLTIFGSIFTSLLCQHASTLY